LAFQLEDRSSQSRFQSSALLFQELGVCWRRRLHSPRSSSMPRLANQHSANVFASVIISKLSFPPPTPSAVHAVAFNPLQMTSSSTCIVSSGDSWLFYHPLDPPDLIIAQNSCLLLARVYRPFIKMRCILYCRHKNGSNAISKQNTLAVTCGCPESTNRLF
jgi:hypothetical protein